MLLVILGNAIILVYTWACCYRGLCLTYIVSEKSMMCLCFHYYYLWQLRLKLRPKLGHPPRGRTNGLIVKGMICNAVAVRTSSWSKVRWTNHQLNQQVARPIRSSVSPARCPIFVCLRLPLCEYQWALSCYHQGLRWQHLSDVSLICLSFLQATGCVFLLGKWNVKCRFKVVMAQQYPGLF